MICADMICADMICADIVICIRWREVGRPASLQRIQHRHIQTICCRITETFDKITNFLTYNFSKEQNVLPEDDLRIETCRSILSVLM